MERIVLKFGGSVLKSTEDLIKITEVVKSYRRPVVIVVSAFYSITDRLIKLTDQTKQGENILSELVQITEAYQKVFLEYPGNESVKKRYIADFELLISEIFADYEKLIQAPSSIAGQNRILSYGERLSAFVVNAVMNAEGVESEEVLPEEILQVSGNQLSNAYVRRGKNLDIVKERLSRSITYVIPGFYGVTVEGDVALFGRGGSDYSAAVIAYALDAVSVDLWKDVSGYLSADPKIVDNPVYIDSITYLEAAELSYFGAKIVHPGTIRPLIKKNIPLNIFDIRRGYGTKGTRVNGVAGQSSTVLKSITYSNDFVLLKLKGAGVGIKKGILREVTRHFDEAGINIRSVITSQIEIDFLLHKKDFPAAYEIALKLNNNFYDIEVDQDIALIAAVGKGIKHQPGIAAKIFGALAQEHINVKHIVFGASEVSLYLIVSQRDFRNAVRKIHHEFFIAPVKQKGLTNHTHKNIMERQIIHKE